MKLTPNSRFPHPVLSTETRDYHGGIFEMAFDVEEDTNNSHVAIRYAVTLSEPGLRKFVEEGSAALGVSVTCKDSYFNEVIPLGLGSDRFAFDEGSLIGRVMLRPLIWSRKPVSVLAESCHSEFDVESLQVNAGEILAFDDEFVINVGREKLSQIETIFVLAETDLLADNELSVDLETERVKILASKSTCAEINTLRGFNTGRAAMLNSVYLPTLMEVLNALKTESTEHEGKRWYRVISAKCEHLGIDMANPEIWRDAQRLLERPFSEISSTVEAWSS